MPKPVKEQKWKPFAIISAFFLPASSVDIRKSIETSQATSKRVADLLRQSDELQRAVEAELRAAPAADSKTTIMVMFNPIQPFF